MIHVGVFLHIHQELQWIAVPAGHVSFWLSFHQLNLVSRGLTSKVYILQVPIPFLRGGWKSE